MTVEIPMEYQPFVASAIACGEFKTEGEVIQIVRVVHGAATCVRCFEWNTRPRKYEIPKEERSGEQTPTDPKHAVIRVFVLSRFRD